MKSMINLSEVLIEINSSKEQKIVEIILNSYNCFHTNNLFNKDFESRFMINRCFIHVTTRKEYVYAMSGLHYRIENLPILTYKEFIQQY